MNPNDHISIREHLVNTKAGCAGSDMPHAGFSDPELGLETPLQNVLTRLHDLATFIDEVGHKNGVVLERLRGAMPSVVDSKAMKSGPQSEAMLSSIGAAIDGLYEAVTQLNHNANEFKELL